MDLPILAEFHYLKFQHYMNMQEFLHIHRQRSDTVLNNLLKIFHIIELKDICWHSDIVNTMNGKPKWHKIIEISSYYMMSDRYIRYGQKDKVLGYEYQITNKGRALLDQYATWIREKEKETYYKMKKSHKESRELKENS